jgi:hypothetical protein
MESSNKEYVVPFPENTVTTIYCADGPLKGGTYSALVKKRKVYLPLHSNPFYKTACYMVTTRLTPLHEFIAVLSHCVKRNRK